MTKWFFPFYGLLLIISILLLLLNHKILQAQQDRQRWELRTVYVVFLFFVLAPHLARALLIPYAALVSVFLTPFLVPLGTLVAALTAAMTFLGNPNFNPPTTRS